MIQFIKAIAFRKREKTSKSFFPNRKFTFPIYLLANACTSNQQVNLSISSVVRGDLPDEIKGAVQDKVNVRCSNSEMFTHVTSDNDICML